MNHYRKYFRRVIQAHYPEQCTMFLVLIDEHYCQISPDTDFARTSKNPIDKRLDFCAYFLALIKTLDSAGESFDSIRKTCLEVVTAYVQPRNKMQAFFKRQLPKLISTWVGQSLIQLFHKRISVNQNTNGFIANIITDKHKTYGLGYGIDILECGICKLFKKHNFGKYASILCEVDEITSSLAGLTLIRSGTIANGAQKCDFRFKRN